MQPANAHVKSAEVSLYVKTAWAKGPNIPWTLRDIPSNPNHNFSTMPAKRWCCHTKPPHFSALTHYIIDLWNETVTVSCPGPSQPSPDEKNLDLKNTCVNMSTTAANHSQASQAIHKISFDSSFVYVQTPVLGFRLLTSLTSMEPVAIQLRAAKLRTPGCLWWKCFGVFVSIPCVYTNYTVEYRW